MAFQFNKTAIEKGNQFLGTQNGNDLGLLADKLGIPVQDVIIGIATAKNPEAVSKDFQADGIEAENKRRSELGAKLKNLFKGGQQNSIEVEAKDIGAVIGRSWVDTVTADKGDDNTPSPKGRGGGRA